jgi:hypothetical protein
MATLAVEGAGLVIRLPWLEKAGGLPRRQVTDYFSEATARSAQAG